MKSKVALAGTLLNILALLFSRFILYRPNRILKGEDYFAYHFMGGYFYLLLSIAALTLILICLKKGKFVSIMGAAFLMLMLYQLGEGARALVTETNPLARVSIGSGVWLSLLGSYMVIQGSNQGLTQKRQRKTHQMIKVGILLLFLILLFGGHFDQLSIMKEYFNRKDSFLSELNRHFLLSTTSVLIGTAWGVPLGLLVFRVKRVERITFMLINLFQTIPTLSLLALLMIPLAYLGQTNQIFSRVGISGTGWAPVLIVLILYALLPITVTTLAGMRMVSNDVMHAAQGIGMTPGQIFWRVQFPIALPVILGGIRVALTQAIGNTILGGLIGAGGMGTLIFLGLAQAAPDLILLGVIPVVLMTLLLDNLLKIVVHKLSRAEGRVAID